MTTTEKITVTIKGDGAGNAVIASKNNPKFGYIRVAQVRTDIDDETGFAKMHPMSALIPGEIPALKSFGWSEGQEVEGKIYVKEQLVPFSSKEPEKDLKFAGKTGIVCSIEGRPIYRKHFFSRNTKVEDVRLQHDNTDEIKAAYAKMKLEEENANNTVASSTGIGAV